MSRFEKPDVPARGTHGELETKRPRRAALGHARAARRRLEVPNEAAIQSNTVEVRPSFTGSHCIVGGTRVFRLPALRKVLFELGTGTGLYRFSLCHLAGPSDDKE